MEMEHGMDDVLVCFSHLRWNFVYQRPQHLMSRCAKNYDVVFFEEPILRSVERPYLEKQLDSSGVTVVTPILPSTFGETEQLLAQKRLLDELLRDVITPPTLWYYTPMALRFSRHLQCALCVYDCMDELSGFMGASPLIKRYEVELFKKANLVFTGGYSLYEAKNRFHDKVYLFPSCVEIKHFGRARLNPPDPIDQASLPHPRLGFFGVIDERLHRDLIRNIAASRPDWHLVLVGPVVKIDGTTLPRAPNIHYLGNKNYKVLPDYLGGWDIALLPFAQNDATRFISPTKTPEYLAGGKPVISTPIRDVVRSYGDIGLASIAETAEDFIATAERLIQNKDRAAWLQRVDAALARQSWDETWKKMLDCMRGATARNQQMISLPVNESLIAPPQICLPKSCYLSKYDWLVVGAGFAGSVLAERLARVAGKKVLVIDKRGHIGGNAYDRKDDAGILIHKYGPHIFHTNSKEVFTYLSRFTKWRKYEHRVLASMDNRLLPFPINLNTVNQLYGLNLSKAELKVFFAGRAEKKLRILTSEDVVISTIGRDLYEKFFQNYTRKQWGMDPAELDSSVAARVSARLNADDRYFTDKYQYMPVDGYTRMFENMLDHPNITVMLHTDFKRMTHSPCEGIIYTGPIDEYFGHCFGSLPYRSLKFEHATRDCEWHQKVGVVNYPQDKDYTRITEFKHLTGQKHPRTSLCYEYPRGDGDPYYPVPCPENFALYEQYQALADEQDDITFIGRLATYRYTNMDQVVAQALSAFRRLVQVDQEQGTAVRHESRAI